MTGTKKDKARADKAAADAAAFMRNRAASIMTYSGPVPAGYLAALSPQDRAAIIEDLRTGETAVRRLRKQLEALQTGDARSCPRCGNPVTGRPDARYCSTTCRVRAHRTARQNNGNG